MIESNNFQSDLGRETFGTHVFLRRNLIAIVRRIAALILRAARLLHDAAILFNASEQKTATLVRIGCFAVLLDFYEMRVF